jgi:hypothetical protein
MVIDQNEAAAALASMREVKGRMVKGPRWGWKYHFLFGGLMGSLMAIQALPIAWRFVGLACCFAAIFLIKKWGRDASGRFINGFRRGRTRIVASVLLATFMAIYLGCTWLAFDRGMWDAPLYGGAAMFVIGVFGDLIWVKAYDADLAEGK